MTAHKKTPADTTNINEGTMNSNDTVITHSTTIFAHLRDTKASTTEYVATKAGERINVSDCLSVYLDLNDFKEDLTLWTAHIQCCPDCLATELKRREAKRLEKERRKREMEAERAQQLSYDTIAREMTNGEAVDEGDLVYFLVEAKRRGEPGWEKYLDALVAIDQKRLDDRGLKDWGLDDEEVA